MIIDLTGTRDGTGPARLLDMVEGRSKTGLQAVAGRTRPALARPGRGGRDGRVHRVKTATSEELPDAVAVMDPFHVVRLAGNALDRCRRRVQQDHHGHRGRTGDPLYSARRTLHTGTDLLTDKQRDRLDTLFADDEHVQVEATWGIYQRTIAAYREPDKANVIWEASAAGGSGCLRRQSPDGPRDRLPAAQRCRAGPGRAGPGEDGAGETDQGVAVGGDADDVGAAAGLMVEALLPRVSFRMLPWT